MPLDKLRTNSAWRLTSNVWSFFALQGKKDHTKGKNRRCGQDVRTEQDALRLRAVEILLLEFQEFLVGGCEIVRAWFLAGGYKIKVVCCRIRLSRTA